jgi:lipopolysaccharide/colanic/teichoic acid biosynthesis glycosyltransferase
LPTTSRPYDVLKRAIDFSIALIALVVLLPVLVAIAVAIFVVDGWPVFFVHHRVGRREREFPIVKFRTLPRAMPRYAPKVPDDDPRASALGRFLRRTGIDEIPQLLNVLVGQMSLVGPRPEQPFIVAGYEPWQHRRHVVRPGMTGPWQASGRKRPLHESTDIELAYIDRRSFGTDASIVAHTLRYVFRSAAATAPRVEDAAAVESSREGASA